jgi:hypothetical protein
MRRVESIRGSTNRDGSEDADIHCHVLLKIITVVLHRICTAPRLLVQPVGRSSNNDLMTFASSQWSIGHMLLLRLI